jgi:hypothetical protein
MINYLELDFEYTQYHQVLCDYVDSIQDSITTSYQKVDLLKFKEHNSKLCGFLESMAQSDLERVIVLTVNEQFKFLPHKDEGPRVCRINWPVLNSDSAYTVFYKTNAGATPYKYEGIDMYHKHDLQVSDTFVLTRPTLMHVNTIHSVETIEGKSLPRIIVSFNFRDDSILQKLLVE